MICYMSSSIDIRISSDSINSDMYNELICINGVGKFHDATVSNMMIMYEYRNKLIYSQLLSIWR